MQYNGEVCCNCFSTNLKTRQVGNMYRIVITIRFRGFEKQYAALSGYVFLSSITIFIFYTDSIPDPNIRPAIQLKRSYTIVIYITFSITKQITHVESLVYTLTNTVAFTLYCYFPRIAYCTNWFATIHTLCMGHIYKFCQSNISLE